MEIRVEKVNKTFQDAERVLTVIDDLSYSFPESSSVAIVGSSGIGKSTFLHMLGGLERVSSGKILFDGVDISSLSPDQLSDFRGKNIGFVFQFHHLLPEFSAVENVAMPLMIGGMAEPQATEQAEEMLTKVGLAERFTHRPGELSGGEQQRVAIARAVVSNPKVLLADEPTGNLDLKTATEIQDILLRINKELGSTLIVVTHNQELAEQMQHVLEMKPGGVLETKVQQS